MQGAADSGTRRTSAGTAWKWLQVAAFVKVRRLQDLGRFGTQVVGRFVGDADDLKWLSAPPSYRLCSVMAKAAPSRKVRTALWPWAPRCSRSCAAIQARARASAAWGWHAGHRSRGHRQIGAHHGPGSLPGWVYIALWGSRRRHWRPRRWFGARPRGQGHGIGAHLLAHAHAVILSSPWPLALRKSVRPKRKAPTSGTAASSSKMTRVCWLASCSRRQLQPSWAIRRRTKAQSVSLYCVGGAHGLGADTSKRKRAHIAVGTVSFRGSDYSEKVLAHSTVGYLVSKNCVVLPENNRHILVRASREIVNGLIPSARIMKDTTFPFRATSIKSILL